MDKLIEDVSSDYSFNYSIEGKLPNTNSKYLFLSVHNTNEWIPLTWSFIINNQYKFENLEGGIVFLPTYYNDGQTVAAADPVYLDDRGECHILAANRDKLIDSMVVTRLCPLNPEKFMLRRRESGDANFDVSNTPEFKEYRTIHTSPRWLRTFRNNIAVLDSAGRQQRFRYLRYKNSMDKNCNNSISEIEFLADSVPLRFTVINSDDFHRTQEADDILFDNDYETYAFMINPGSQIVFDFGKTVSVDKFSFAVGILDEEKSRICDGHSYQLSYWEDGKWNGADIAEAVAGYAVFKVLYGPTLSIPPLHRPPCRIPE